MTTAFDLLHPTVQRKLWELKWTHLRPIQDEAIRHLLLGGGDAVISSPTASGKTEAAFLPVLSAIADSPFSSVRAMYIGPLKALINDQFGRVETLCERMEMPVCRWHGDVGDTSKQRLLDRPSGVLLITPESLEALLIRRATLFPKLFCNLGFVVVDEMHAFIGTERGAQLVSQLARVDHRVGCKPVRIGLSATLGDPSAVLRWLRPNGAPAALIQDGDGQTSLKVKVRGFWARKLKEEDEESDDDPVIHEVARGILGACHGKTNLVFANAKARIEVLADALASEATKMGLPDEIVVHHGSLSKERRHHAEERLRSKKPCTAVCSNTLEMGIDIGQIDSVVQLSAPWSVASLTQRVGRSGRRENASRILRGFFVESATDEKSSVWDRLHLDFIQGIATTALMLEKAIEPPAVGRAHLSTLIHQILAVTAETGGAAAHVLFERVVRSGAFGDVSKSDFAAVLRQMGQRDLVEQMGDGTLILGMAGQKLVDHYSFYAAFNAADELRVVHGTEEVGTVYAPPAPGEHLILAGRRWRVEQIDGGRREVVVSPAHGRSPPVFTPSRGAVSEAVQKRMRALLVGAEEPIYLDSVAVEILRAARAEAARHHAFKPPVNIADGSMRLFVFGGYRVQQTLSLVLSRAKLQFTDEDIGFDVDASSAEVAAALRAFAEQPDLLALAAYADDKLHYREFGREKFEQYAAPPVWRRAFAAEELDIAARFVAMDLAQAIAVGAWGQTSQPGAAPPSTAAPARARCVGPAPIVSRFIRGGDSDRDGIAHLAEPVWGPVELLRDLELRLGLPPLDASAAVRAHAYALRLQAGLERAPFYARSFEMDPHGTATTLLSWRDQLIEAGWRGEDLSHVSPRVASLVRAESAGPEPMPLGLADRLARVEAELRCGRAAVYERLELLEPSEVWPAGWQNVLKSLSARGTKIAARPRRQWGATGSSDLAWTQRHVGAAGSSATRCDWRGDGSLVHLTARTSWELGESVAGLIRSRGERDLLVIRLGDAAPLDAALSLQGMASQGQATSSPLRSPLQVLSLALALMFAPRDPYRALEMLTLPRGPFGPYAAGILADAIGRAPGIGGRRWQEAKEALRLPKDPANSVHVAAAQKSTQKIAAWFEGPTFDRIAGAPKEEVLSVVARVRAWALRRPHDEGGVKWAVLVRSVHELEQLVRAHPRPLLLPHEVEQLSARAIGPGMRHDVTDEQAGRPPYVSTPHAVLREHDAIIVWHAGFDPNARRPQVAWRASELRAFESAGLNFGDSKKALEIEGQAWRDAFAAARGLFAVATAKTHLSDAQPALPLWDEIVARSAATARDVSVISFNVTTLLGQGPLAEPLSPIALPDARKRWAADPWVMQRALGLVKTLYPTAIENLVVCPLRWVVESVLRVRRSRLTSVPEKTQLYGTLGHRLAEELHARGALDKPEQVAAMAERCLDELIEQEGGPLLMPGMTAERGQVREALVDAMRELSKTIADSGMRVVGVEVETSAAWGARELGGRIDLLLERSDGRGEVILDLKYGESRYREALSKGLALQIATYAETRRREKAADAPIEAAYFALKKRRTLALAGSTFQNARTIQGEPLHETWAKTDRAVAYLLDQVGQGVVHASASADAKVRFSAHHDIPPAISQRHYDAPAASACTYCSNGTLCGRSWKETR